jgi:hypothetical protein
MPGKGLEGPEKFMVAALYVTAMAMAASGLCAVFVGGMIVGLERGWTMAICGTIAACAGILVAVLGVLLAELRRLSALVARLPGWGHANDEIHAPAVLTEAPLADTSPASEGLSEAAMARRLFPTTGERQEWMTAWTREGALALERIQTAVRRMENATRSALKRKPATPEETSGDASTETLSDAAVAASRVVGRHRADGVLYTLFEDGSIEADTPSGRYRFASMDELRYALATPDASPAAA